MLDYYYEKLLQAICFSEKPKKYLNDKLLNPIFINKFKEFLIECNNYSIYDEKMKENLLDVTDYYRYHGQKELANEFILLINGSDIDSFFWIDYFQKEYELRKNSKKDEFNITSTDCISDLFYSLEMDYIVLRSLICNDEVFENDLLEYLMLNEFYFLSCRKMVEENPKLFDNQKAWIRICTINLANEKMKKHIDKEQTKDYKRILGTGKKVIKKVIK